MYLGLGLFAGLLAGLFGIGGGLIIVPILHFAFTTMKVPSDQVMHLAVGTSLATIFITGLNSVWSHYRLSNINWDVVKKMVPAIMIGTFVGGRISGLIPGKVLETIFLIYVLIVAVKMWLNNSESQPPKSTSHFIYSLFGFIIGLKSPLLGIGGGTISIPFLTWRGFSMKQSVGASAVFGLPIALIGAIMAMINGYAVVDLPYSLGFVYWPAVLGIGMTSSFSARVGARLTHKFPQKTLQRSFAVFLLILLIKAFFSK